MSDHEPDSASGPPEAFLRERRRDVHQDELWSPFRYVGRQLRRSATRMIDRAELAPGDVVIDFGCADVPYRDLLDAFTYLPVDLPGNVHSALDLDANGSVPMPDGCCRLVLSTQVLEHVPDPRAYLAEAHRLLEPGGSLALTTHGIMYLHRDPTDYWRWTCDGLRRLVEESGFEVVELRGILGLVPAALQLLQDGMGAKVPRRLRKPYIAVFQGLISMTDRRTSAAARDDNALVFAVFARKPA